VIEELGSATHVIFPIDAPPVDVASVRAASDDNERAVLLVDSQASFTAEVDETSSARSGASLKLALNPARLHFFDRESGEALAAAKA
jgi:multiple sugar transport system ATP-binding protein